MKKKLIVSGCSFTNKDFISCSYPSYDCSFPKWPELLGEKLNMEVINLGNSGAGNRYILQTLVEEIEKTSKDEIGLVIAAWSQSNRDDFEYKKQWKNTRKSRTGDIDYWVKETCLFYLMFQNTCKRYNLPYLQFQMISLFDGWLSGLSKNEDEILKNLRNPDPNFEPRYKFEGDKKEYHKRLSKLMLEYEKFTDTNNFLGYPGVRTHGGYTIEHESIMRDVKREDGKHDYYEIMEDRVIGSLDKHPNEKGHEEITKVIYNKLTEKNNGQLA